MGAAVAAESARQTATALARAPRRCRSDGGLSKALSFLSDYAPGGKPRGSAKVNGKIAEWFNQVIGFFKGTSVSLLQVRADIPVGSGVWLYRYRLEEANDGR